MGNNFALKISDNIQIQYVYKLESQAQLVKY